MSCGFVHLDGVYVLGALAPAERVAYERHLPGCAECSRALRDLAGLPGLLGRVAPDVVEELQLAEPLPTTLLPGLVAQARRSRGRRRAVLASLVAAAAVVLAVAAVGIGASLRDDVPEVAAAQRMESLGTASSGWVSLSPRQWGTQIDLTCTYEGPVAGTATYVLVVRSTGGDVEQVGSWRTGSGEEVHVSLATSVPPGDIASVEVRTATGYPVLRLDE